MNRIVLSLCALCSVAVTSWADAGYRAQPENEYASYAAWPNQTARLPASGYDYHIPGDRSPEHQDLHWDLKQAERDLHRELQESKRNLDRSIKDQVDELNRRLKRERAFGVPDWQRRAERDAVERDLSQIRQAGRRQLRQAHEQAHDQLRQAHREAHFDLAR